MTDSVRAHSAASMARQHNYGSLRHRGAQGSNEGARLLSDSPKSVQQSAEKIGKASSSVIGKVAYVAVSLRKQAAQPLLVEALLV